ncbi:Signal transduction histidine kinase [Dyadobacter soli]|uniref:histidine kinase n=1 Tax=Dyadobacter soli TaxID=659014 RepID=A0A1G7PU02_9BACT|nr:HAMP domain-containing sensor histidine kinase [Dyadobacter soli]SDF89802.1 Signal transduction histidine kinase [Dyadobacter soli]
MGKHLRFLFALVACGGAAFAQSIPDLSAYKTPQTKLKRLVTICDSLTLHEQHAALHAAAQYGIRITPPADLKRLAYFHYRLGYALETTSKSDSCFRMHEKSLEYAKKARDTRQTVLTLNRLLFLYNNVAGYKGKADASLKEALAMIDTLRNPMDKIELYSSVQNYYSTRGEYEKQVRYLLESIEFKKKLITEGKVKDREYVVSDLMNLGELYIELQQGENGVRYSKEARGYMVSNTDYRNHYYKDMTDAYLLLKQPAMARTYYDSLSAMLEPGNIQPRRRSNKIAADLGFTDYYLNINQPDSAAIYIRRASQLAEKWAPDYLLSQVRYMQGSVYYAQGRYQEALPILVESEDMIRDFGQQMYVALLQSIARCYAAAGDWKKAYAYYDKYAPMRDSLYLESSRKSIADAEALYQNKEKQREIQIKNLQIDEAQKQRIWLISGLAFVSLSLVLLGIIYRNKRRTAALLDEKNRQLNQLIAELEEANRTKAKLFGIISHDLRSPINQVYQFLKLQQLNPDLLNHAQKQQLSEKIQTATGSLLETMEDLLLWSKTQMNQFQPSIEIVRLAQVTDQCLGLLHLNIEARQLTIEQRIPQEVLVETDPYYLQTILRNLLQNAVKAADEQSMVRLDWQEAQRELYIENSGPAFTQAQYESTLAHADKQSSLSGLGLRLVDELSTKSGLAVRFENPADGVTRTVIKFM